MYKIEFWNWVCATETVKMCKKLEFAFTDKIALPWIFNCITFLESFISENIQFSSDITQLLFQNAVAYIAIVKRKNIHWLPSH